MRVPKMPPFIDANNLQPFVGKDLKGVPKKIDFLTQKGRAKW